MDTPERHRPTPPGTGDAIDARVSDVSGGQVAIGGQVIQIDADGGAQVVINAEADVTVTRRPAPIIRPTPPFPGLVGRSREVTAIRKALTAGRGVEVVGPSGIGKTALLRAVSNTDLPQTTPDGVVAVPAQLGVPDSLNYVFDACYEGSRRVVPRRAELAESLAGLRLLVVSDDPGLNRDDIDLLRQALPSSRFLFAAHERRVFAEVDGVELEGLDEESGLQLIEGALGRQLTERERGVGREVCQRLDGTPIELVRFAGLVRADDGDLVSVARGFGVDAQPEQILVAVQRAASPEEDAVLAALAAVGAPVGAGPVAAMSGQPDAGELLVRLARKGLVSGDDLQGWRARARSAPSIAVRHHVAVTFGDWMRRRVLPEEVAAEIPAITATLRSAAVDGRHDDAVALAASAERPLALAGRWAAWQEVLSAGVGAARAAGDGASEQYFSHQLGVVRDAMGDTGGWGAQQQPVTQQQADGGEAQQTPHHEQAQPPERPPFSGHGTGGPLPPVPRPWWKGAWGILALAGGLLIGLALVFVFVPAALDDNGTGSASARVDFGQVPLGNEAVESRNLALPAAELPLEVLGADEAFQFLFADDCGLAAHCGVDVVFGPVEIGMAEASAQLVDSTGVVVAEVNATGEGSETIVEGPNLVAFTLAEESGVLQLDVRERRTIRVWNQPGVDVADAEGGSVLAQIDGPAVLLDPEVRGCSLLDDQHLECEFGALRVDQTVNLAAVILAREASEVALRMTATDLLGNSRDQVWVYAVDRGGATEQACTVPEVRGLFLDDATAALEEAGLQIDSVVVEDGQALGLVLDQQPDPGTQLDCGAVVQVQFSGVG